MNTSGQYIAGNSILHRLDARVKFFSFLILVVGSVVTDSVWGYLLLFLLTALLGVLSGFSAGTVLGTVRRIWKFFIFIFLLNAVFFESENPLWSFWILRLSLDGIVQGLHIILRIFAVTVLANILLLTTAPMELMMSVEVMLSPLRIFRLPVEQAAMILSVSIQFIPTLLEETDTIKKAQIARGARFESKRLWQRVMALPPLIIPVFLSAFQRADDLSVAMESRGYRDAHHRTRKRFPPVRKSELLVIAAAAMLCALEFLL